MSGDRLAGTEALEAILLALRGAHRTLKRSYPPILYEVESAFMRQYWLETADLSAFLGGLGYSGHVYIGVSDSSSSQSSARATTSSSTLIASIGSPGC